MTNLESCLLVCGLLMASSLFAYFIKIKRNERTHSQTYPSLRWLRSQVARASSTPSLERHTPSTSRLPSTYDAEDTHQRAMNPIIGVLIGLSLLAFVMLVVILCEKNR